MLTEEQIKAITSDKGYILLNAGPGSGKTTVLTERIVHMVKNWKVPENKIHGFTFTIKATNEMNNRLNMKLGMNHKVELSNFHQYTFNYLRSFFI